MKLENQVCSLKLAKKLKGLGVKQKSLFWWDANDAFQEWFLRQPLEPRNKMIAVSAFTVAELGEMLPRGFYTEKFRDKFRGMFHDHMQMVTIETTEANARAKMLIYLKEETKRGGEEND